MKLEVNTYAPNIRTKDFLGNVVDLNGLRGQKVLVSFFRFSTCPFCNLRIYRLNQEYEEIGLKIIAIFESSNEHLNQHLSHYVPKFSIISDSSGKYYRLYGVEKSFFGMLKGILTRPMDIFKGLAKGKSPLWGIDGNIMRMPAEFLIDEEGVIKELMYAKDEGEHLDVEILKRFALKTKKEKDVQRG